jgi:hypothetical protein
MSDQSLEPIHNFKDHDQLKYEPASVIYLLDRKFYYADREGLQRVTLIEIGYTNMGDPFRELARLEFKSKSGSDLIDIEMADAVKLCNYCRSIGYRLSISTYLERNKSFVRAMEGDDD